MGAGHDLGLADLTWPRVYLGEDLREDLLRKDLGEDLLGEDLLREDLLREDLLGVDDLLREDLLGVDDLLREDLLRVDHLLGEDLLGEDLLREDLLGVDHLLGEDLLWEDLLREDLLREDLLGEDLLGVHRDDVDDHWMNLGQDLGQYLGELYGGQLHWRDMKHLSAGFALSDRDHQQRDRLGGTLRLDTAEPSVDGGRVGAPENRLIIRAEPRLRHGRLGVSYEIA
jgi:hypothetical protein